MIVLWYASTRLKLYIDACWLLRKCSQFIIRVHDPWSFWWLRLIFLPLWGWCYAIWCHVYGTIGKIVVDWSWRLIRHWEGHMRPWMWVCGQHCCLLCHHDCLHECYGGKTVILLWHLWLHYFHSRFCLVVMVIMINIIIVFQTFFCFVTCNCDYFTAACTSFSQLLNSHSSDTVICVSLAISF